MTVNDMAIAFGPAQYRLATRNRPLRLVLEGADGTADELLLPQRVAGSEAICGGFEFRIFCVAASATLPLKNFIGAACELQVVTDRGQLRRICGIVTEAASGQSDGGLASYQLVIRDALSVLENRSSTRVFRDKNELDIIEILVGEWQRSMPVLAGAFDLQIDPRLAGRIRAELAGIVEQHQCMATRGSWSAAGGASCIR